MPDMRPYAGGVFAERRTPCGAQAWGERAGRPSRVSALISPFSTLLKTRLRDTLGIHVAQFEGRAGRCSLWGHLKREPCQCRPLSPVQHIAPVLRDDQGQPRDLRRKIPQLDPEKIRQRNVGFALWLAPAAGRKKPN